MIIERAIHTLKNTLFPPPPSFYLDETCPPVYTNGGGKLYDYELYLYSQELAEQLWLLFAPLLPPLPQSGKFIDIGAGTGTYGRNLAQKLNYTYTAFDYSPYATSYRLRQEKWIQGQAPHFPFKDNSFTCVFSKDLLPHIPVEDLTLFLQELFRITTDDGVSIIVWNEFRAPLTRQHHHSLRSVVTQGQTEFPYVIGGRFTPCEEDWYINSGTRMTRAYVVLAKLNPTSK